jgi:excisionase family DNA binding protein
MTAYATAERLCSGQELRSLPSSPPAEPPLRKSVGGADISALDELLARPADLVVDRLAQRSRQAEPVEKWMDTRRAAEYLGVHRDTLRKLAAERAIPTHQDGPGCKLYFRRDELDEWRRSCRPSARGLRAVS